MFYEHIANAAGGFAANPYAGPDGIVEGAVGDSHVFARNTDDVGLHAAAALKRDAIVARLELAAIDDHMFAGIHGDAVGSAMHGYVFESDVLAVHRMGGPHVVALCKDILDEQILTVGKFHQSGMANDVLACDVGGAIGIARRSCGRPRVDHGGAVGTHDT